MAECLSLLIKLITCAKIFCGMIVTIIFIEVIHSLQKGVIVEIHDIFLPNDYPPHWSERYYSEQYLLAEGIRFDILLPNAFINNDPELLKNWSQS